MDVLTSAARSQCMQRLALIAAQGKRGSPACCESPESIKHVGWISFRAWVKCSHSTTAATSCLCQLLRNAAHADGRPVTLEGTFARLEVSIRFRLRSLKLSAFKSLTTVTVLGPSKDLRLSAMARPSNLVAMSIASTVLSR